MMRYVFGLRREWKGFFKGRILRATTLGTGIRGCPWPARFSARRCSPYRGPGHRRGDVCARGGAPVILTKGPARGLH